MNQPTGQFFPHQEVLGFTHDLLEGKEVYHFVLCRVEGGTNLWSLQKPVGSFRVLLLLWSSAAINRNGSPGQVPGLFRGQERNHVTNFLRFS